METVKADNRQRVRIPDIKPGQVFALETSGNVIQLTPVKKVGPSPGNARLKKKGRFTLLVTDAVVSRAELQKALDDLP